MMKRVNTTKRLNFLKKAIFVQPQFSAKSAELVANEINGEVAFVDPLAENWPANLREVANKFKAALK